MPDGAEQFSLTVADGIEKVEAAEWDACAGSSNPFVAHAFFSALESSGSAAAATGWVAQHLALRGLDGRVCACAPVYLKSHSYGEYVFDWSWADAYERAGGRYYPKLQAAVPFSPVTGPRLLSRPDGPSGANEALARGLVHLAETTRVSSLHVTFATEAECRLLARHGFLIRTGIQYHWQNRGYASFEDFLGDLSSRKRKAIRKERAAAASHDVVIRDRAGSAIEERHWDAFYSFYRDTAARKNAHAYLSRAFFSALSRGLGHRVLLVLAETPDRTPVAGALHLVGEDTLYGRYWGAIGAYDRLHFEMCYYRAIDFAIRSGLARIEAGAQGEHKIQRGYLPQLTWSAHWIADRSLRAAVDRFLTHERPAVDDAIERLATLSPFRNEPQA
ncbi:MAG: GNAT family N-acetyltransferase [Defluviicoccus sp.]